MDWINENLSSVCLAAGVAILCMVMLRKWMQHFRRRKKDNRPIVHTAEPKRPGSRPHSGARLGDYHTELDRQKVQMFDMVRDFQAEVDTRLRILQQYTVTAERLAQRLEKAIERAEKLGVDLDDKEEVRT